MLPVLYPSGNLAYMATFRAVRAQEKSGVLRTFGRGKRVWGAMLVCGPVRPRCGERTTHNHETPDNPRGVWTFRKGQTN